MDIKVVTSQIVNGHQITSRQIEVLCAVRKEGSMNAAAKKLGISTPVVHKNISSMESGTGMTLVKTTPEGTVLTDDAIQILDTARIMSARCDMTKRFVIGCTPVTEELLMTVLSSKIKGELIVSNDVTNIRLLKQGLLDIIILDDPMHLFELDGFLWTEIGQMDMIHVDNGPSYIRYKYGAQRIAYEYLKNEGREFSVDAETHVLNDLLNSKKSFFVDEFLLMRKGVKLKSATDKRLLRHSITAVYRKNIRCVDRLLKAIRAKHLI